MPHEISPGDRDTFDRLKRVRAEAIEHTKQARRLALERREIMVRLMDTGYSQADIARELDVSRQAIQKMLSMVPPTPTTPARRRIKSK
jgi:DNA-binding NarL/FixJ family response regulator